MILNLLAIILIGILTTYTDIKKRIIKNNVILIGLILSVLLYIYQAFQNPEIIAFSQNIILGAFFSVVIGVLLWYIRVWPAGDAKLFIIYSLLIPVSVLQTNGLSTSFDFLINTFVPIFFAMLLVTLARSKKSEIRKSLKFALNPYKFFMSIVVITGFLWFAILPIQAMGLPDNYIIHLIILFAIMEIFTNILPFNPEYLYVTLAAVRIIIDYQNVFTLGFAYYMFSLIVIFVFMRYFVIDLGFSMYTAKKKVEDIAVGDYLAEGILEVTEKGKTLYRKEKISHFSIMQGLKERGGKKYIHSDPLNGIAEKDVDKIKEIRKSGKLGFEEILVHRITPFALFLFIGILLTVFFGTNFFSYMKIFLMP